MAEPRCGLIHMPSGRALAKLARGDCDAAMSDFALSEKTRRKLRRSAYEFKLQVASADSDRQPELIWIRIGVHPQRCLCAGADGRVRLEQWFSPSAPEPQWRLHMLEAQETGEEGETFPALCLLQSVKTGEFLAASQDGTPQLSAKGDLWGLVRLRAAMTPGKVLRRSALVGGGGVAVASVGAVGVVGASAAGAAARGTAAVSAIGSSVSAASTAVSTAVTAVSALSIAKAAAALAAIPSAVSAAMAAGGAATAAVATVGATVPYALVGVGCGAALGAASSAASAAAGAAKVTARLVGSAKDPSLYVHGYPFLPAPLSRTASRLSTLSKESRAMTRTASELLGSDSEPEPESDE